MKQKKKEIFAVRLIASTKLLVRMFESVIGESAASRIRESRISRREISREKHPRCRQRRIRSASLSLFPSFSPSVSPWLVHLVRVSCEPPTARDTNLAVEAYLAYFFDFERRRRANKLGLPESGGTEQRVLTPF